MIGHFSLLPFVLLIGLLTIAGCEQPEIPLSTGNADVAEATPEVNPHDVPLTAAEIESLKISLTSYEDALAKINGYRDAIRDAIARGKNSEAHRPLDELDIVLGHLPNVARETNIPKSEWETINLSAQSVREMFNQVHARVDAGQEPDFEAVSEEINTQIAVLEGAAAFKAKAL